MEPLKLDYDRHMARAIAINNLIKAGDIDTQFISDGYHTFSDLYHHRTVLFSVVCAMFKDKAWKSKLHHDGTMYDGYFIAGIDTPKGQATYHNEMKYWYMFNIRELENAPEYDGHYPEDAIERIGELKDLFPVS